MHIGKLRFEGSAVRAIGSLAVCIALLVSSEFTPAAEIAIKVRGCEAGVELLARDAPLLQVLQRLATALAFRLDVEDKIDDVVNVSMSAPGPELLARLLADQQRVMVSHAQDPHCPGKSRVTRIWLLRQGQAAGRPEVHQATVKPASLTQAATPDQLRAHEQRARQLKQQYDEHVSRHGKPPPEQEQEEAKP